MYQQNSPQANLWASGTAMYDWFSDIQLEKNVSKKGDISHPCQIPVALMERILLLLTDEKTIVIDPFCGLASVGVAAGRLNRRFIGIEISKKYFKMAEKRLGV